MHFGEARQKIDIGLLLLLAAFKSRTVVGLSLPWISVLIILKICSTNLAEKAMPSRFTIKIKILFLQQNLARVLPG